jgi:tRNA uridine 5-carboxymethylaminomethyl modification enzyme
MFTSRAEHRLRLRIDNADLRLTPLGRGVGLVDDERWERFEARRGRLERNLHRLETNAVRIGGEVRPAATALRRPEVRVADFDVAELGLELDPGTGALDRVSLETSVKYAGYLKRQEAEIARMRKDERKRIPLDFRYDRVPGLSREIVQRLTQVRPETMGQAGRIPGVTPAAVAVLGIYVNRSEAAVS